MDTESFGDAGHEPIGREQELHPVRSWLSRPEASRVVLLHGERGIGKTSVWRRAMDMAAAQGCRVLTCRPAQAEAEMPFAALGDLLRSVKDDELAALAAPQRRALGVALVEVSPGGETVDIREASLGLLRLVQRMSAEGPVVIGVDDLQWLDGSTEAVGRFVFRRLNDRPVLVVATYDTGLFGAEGDDPVLRPEDLEERLIPIQVPPLPDEDLRRLLRTRSVEGWSSGLIRTAVRMAGGNPGLALQLTREGEEVDGGPLTPPEAVMRWVRARRSSISEAAGETLEAAACLEDPPVHLLQRLRGNAVDHLGEAARAGLIQIAAGRVRFTRPIIAAAVYRGMRRERRREVHRHLAAVLPEPIESRRHQALAAIDFDEDLAGALEQASRNAGAGGDVERASALAELAVRMTGSDQSRAGARRRMLLAEWRLQLGDDRPAADLLSDVAERLLPAGPERTRIGQCLARLELRIRGVVASQRRLAACGSETAGDNGLAAALEADLSFLHYIRGDLSGAVAQGARVLELANDEELSKRGEVLVAAADAAAGAASWARMPALEDLSASAEILWDDRPSIALGVRRAMAGDDLSGIGPALNRLTRTASGDSMWLGWQAEAECWRDRWDEAASLTERAVQLAWETGEWVALARLFYVRALIGANRGLLDEARRAALEGVDVAARAGLTMLVTLNRAVLAYVGMLARSGPLSTDVFEPILRAPMPGVEPGLLRLSPNAVEGLIEAGSLHRAIEHLARLDACRSTLPARWLRASCARCHGAAAAASGRLEDAEEWLVQAVDTELVAPRRLELGRHFLTLGVVRRRRRRRGLAADVLEQAKDIFTELGAEAWRSRAETEARRLHGGRGFGREPLTATQQRVAELVAQGKSNKEVALALSLSVHTVESNLRAIFRKFGVGSRAALGLRLSDNERRGMGR
jgi:DNA-binding CsgD family transcriptional regulator